MTGTGFQSGFTARLINELGQQFPASPTQFISSTTVTVTVSIGAGPTSATQSIQITNPDAQTATINFQALGVTTLTITTGSLPEGRVGQSYTATLNASGGNPPYSWSQVSGSMPAGLTLSSTGVIGGTPTSAGASSFAVRVQDTGSPAQSAAKPLSITVVGTPPGAFTLTAESECSGQNPQTRLTWTPSSGVDFYQAYRNGSLLTGLTATTNTYLDTAVIIGATYMYHILAINSGGQTSSNQVAITARCETPPGTFTLTVIPWCDGTAPINLLEWTAPAGRAFPYEAYRNNVLVFTTDLNRYEDRAVAAGATYSYFEIGRAHV